MKSLTTLLFTAGLVSAVSISPAPVASQASSNGQAEAIANIFNSSASLNGSQISAADPSFDPASLNLNNVGGINLGQVDFSNQNSVASAILSMLNVLCAGNLFDVNSILGLGVNNDLELFLELVQLMQLEQLGFLNVFDIQALLGSGFSSSLFGGSNSNVFNLGFFKREVSERKKTMKRTKLRRSSTKAKRQCQAGAIDPSAVASVAPDVAAPAASAASEAAAPPSVSAAPAAAPAAPPAAAAPAPAAAAPADDGESLSDFTR